MNIVLIGISTGGPKTLNVVFRDMPQLNACIIIVQHMPAYINKSFRQSLDTICDMDVQLAGTGKNLAHGQILIAPGNVHLTIKGNRKTRLVQGDKVQFVRPAIDVAMTSIQKSSDNIIGIIMTGMGKDGKRGISHIKDIGGDTIAQEKNSCVIPSMPQAAIQTGAVNRVLTHHEIRNELIKKFAGSTIAQKQRVHVASGS